jgi:Uma2 family endonuclease
MIQKFEYPETDGRPMGETDIHIEWMIRIRDMLKYRYRGQRVYVASNLLVYYEAGNPARYLVPDNFVVLDCDPGRRRTYRIWEEGKAPDVVIEVTSVSTRREDESFKAQIYARLGVKEYFLYDPTSEYLDPPLRGFRLEGDEFGRIRENETGVLVCETLGLTFGLEGEDLVLRDCRTGDVLQTEAEAAEAARAAERQAREAAERRAAKLAAELQRLREQLDRKNS